MTTSVLRILVPFLVQYRSKWSPHIIDTGLYINFYQYLYLCRISTGAVFVKYNSRRVFSNETIQVTTCINRPMLWCPRRLHCMGLSTDISHRNACRPVAQVKIIHTFKSDGSTISVVPYLRICYKICYAYFSSNLKYVKIRYHIPWN